MNEREGPMSMPRFFRVAAAVVLVAALAGAAMAQEVTGSISGSGARPV